MSLVRRNSSKAGLHNLMKLTAQRSVEDAEEVERERRRRAREMRRRDSGSVRGESPESDTPTEDSQLDGSYKPSSSPSLEEDEGFSDWTQRRERQKQLRQQEQTQLHHHHQKNGARDQKEEEQEQRCEPNTGQGDSQPSLTASRLQKQEQERQEMERRKQRQEEAVRADRARREKEREREEKTVEDRRRREDVTRVKEERNRPIEAERKTEVKLSCTSRVVLTQEPKHADSNGNASPQEKISHSNKTSSWARRSSNRSVEPEENEAILETEQRLEKIRRGLQEKESQELEQLRQRQTEAEHELQELKRRREERRRIREEEERRRGEEEQSRLAREEEDKRRMKEDIERRRTEAAERMKSLSTASEGDQTFSPFSPKTPTYKITERTESLNRSLKKSNSFKKTAPLVLTSKIDDKLEQYTHAIENSIETRSVKSAPNDLPNTPEVATKKNLFEAGEVFSQSPTKGPGCKDTEGLKVGVANLITQWVKGPNDPTRPGPGKSTDVKPGDVMQKRNMWEGMGESFRPGQRKGSTSGTKYKFVVSGHGKYEKKAVDGETEGEFSDDL